MVAQVLIMDEHLVLIIDDFPQLASRMLEGKLMGIAGGDGRDGCAVEIKNLYLERFSTITKKYNLDTASVTALHHPSPKSACAYSP